jgi:hypothetical protein
VVGTYLLRPGHSSKSFAAVLRLGAYAGMIDCQN